MSEGPLCCSNCNKEIIEVDGGSVGLYHYHSETNSAWCRPPSAAHYATPVEPMFRVIEDERIKMIEIDNADPTGTEFCGLPRDPDKLMFGMSIRCPADTSLDDIKDILAFNYMASCHETDWPELRVSPNVEYVEGPVQEDEEGPYRLFGWRVQTHVPSRAEPEAKFLHTPETSLALSMLHRHVDSGECSEAAYRSVLGCFWILDKEK